MKTKLLILFCSVLLSSLWAQKKQTKLKSGNVIVELAKDVKINNPKNIKQEVFLKDEKLKGLNDVLNVYNYKHIINNYYLIEYSNLKYSVEKAMENYVESNLIDYAQPNYIGKARETVATPPAKFVPNDQYYNYQWYLHNDGNYVVSQDDASWDYLNATPKKGADINMEKAWALEKGSKDLIIAIVDGGVFMEHPEFAGRIWKNKKEIANNNKDDDNNGFIDDVRGWDFNSNDNDPSDPSGHGTAVAGICSASNNNSIGYAGINGNSKIMSVRVDGDNYTSANLALGIKYATKNGAKIINLSLGQYGEGNLLKEAVKFAYSKKVIMIAATANDGTRIGGSETFCKGGEARHDFPGCFSQIITVGGTTYNDYRMVWQEPNKPSDPANPKEGSAYGNHIDVVAPGYSIFSLGHKGPEEDKLYPPYPRYGCSFATPQVTGVISLMLSMNPELTFKQIRDILRSSADDKVGRPSEDTSGRDMYMGYGRLNAYKALLATQKTMGITDVFKDEANTSIYPNPVEDILTVNSKKQIKNLTVYSVLGAEILSVYNTKTLDLSSLKGTFLLKITLENGSSFVKKIICK